MKKITNIPFAYRAIVIPKGKRSAISTYIIDSVSVKLVSVSKDVAPIVINVAQRDEFTDGIFVDEDIRMYDGNLYKRINNNEKGLHPDTGKSLKSLSAADIMEDDDFNQGRHLALEKYARNDKYNRLDDFSSCQRSDREYEVAEVKASSKNIIVIDGIVWRKIEMPFIDLSLKDLSEENLDVIGSVVFKYAKADDKKEPETDHGTDNAYSIKIGLDQIDIYEAIVEMVEQFPKKYLPEVAVAPITNMSSTYMFEKAVLGWVEKYLQRTGRHLEANDASTIYAWVELRSQLQDAQHALNCAEPFSIDAIIESWEKHCQTQTDSTEPDTLKFVRKIWDKRELTIPCSATIHASL